MFLGIIHRPVFYLKYNISETEFCLRLQIKPIQLGPIDTASPYLRTSAQTQYRVYKPGTTQTIFESYEKTLKDSTCTVPYREFISPVMTSDSILVLGLIYVEVF
jgi:hypothetical protein